MSAQRIAVWLLLLVIGGRGVEGQVTNISEKKSGKSWTKAPKEFRGLTFGMTEADARGVIDPLRCGGEPLPPGVRSNARSRVICRNFASVGKFAVSGVDLPIAFLFLDGALTAIHVESQTGIRAKRVPFADAQAAFEKDYGPPTSESVDRNKGVGYQKQQLWDGKKMVTKSHPIPFDYIKKCATWDGETAFLRVCSKDDVFEKATLSPGLKKQQE